MCCNAMLKPVIRFDGLKRAKLSAGVVLVKIESNASPYQYLPMYFTSTVDEGYGDRLPSVSLRSLKKCIST